MVHTPPINYKILNKMIRIILISLSLTLLSWGVNAHSPDLSSTILSKQGENKWILQVRAALTAYEYEVHLHFGVETYSTPEEFQELVLQHVKENLSIQFGDNQKVILKNGIVKLGHETNAIFEVVGVPEYFHNIIFTNSSFKNISRNQSALIIFKEGLDKKQFTLNNANQHTANLGIKEGAFVLLNSSDYQTSTMGTPGQYLWVGLLGCLLGFLMFLKFKPSKLEV